MSHQANRGRELIATQIEGGAPQHACRGSSLIHRRLSPDRGQTVVEFAMVLPIVAALLIVLLQFGKIIYSYIGLTHLANEGARYGAVNKFPGGNTTVGGYLCPKLGTDPATTGKQVAVTFTAATPGSPTAGDAVTVTVSENYKLIPKWGGVTIPVRSSASMRLEQPPTYAAGTTTC